MITTTGEVSIDEWLEAADWSGLVPSAPYTVTWPDLMTELCQCGSDVNLIVQHCQNTLLQINRINYSQMNTYSHLNMEAKMCL